MDNALIDDRRVHVDFSQSVAKLWYQYRRPKEMNKGKFQTDLFYSVVHPSAVLSVLFHVDVHVETESLT